jgi:hypothetical protein
LLFKFNLYRYAAGLLESARSLERESGVSLSKTDAADNVDLRGIMQEWEGVYEAKFGRRPKMVRQAVRLVTWTYRLSSIDALPGLHSLPGVTDWLHGLCWLSSVEPPCV